MPEGDPLLSRVGGAWQRYRGIASTERARRLLESVPLMHDRLVPFLRPDPPNWFLPRGYVARDKAEYFDDANDSGIVYQPDVYPFAAHLARRFGATHVIDVGCGAGQKLAALHPEFAVVGLDYQGNIELCRRLHGDRGTWLDVDLEQPGALPLSKDVVDGSVVICSDVIEHLSSPRHLLSNLRALSRSCSALVISTPERDLARGVGDPGPPANPCHVREWTLREFGRLLQWAGLRTAFIGLTTNNTHDLAKETILAVCEGAGLPALEPAPSRFRVLAIMTAYNEEDIIVPSIQALLDGGIEVHLIDNWSTDGTVDRAVAAAAGRAFTWERFPPDAPGATYGWKALLDRVDEVASRVGADWCMHHDADERRSGPWPGVSLRDALHHAQRCGFNAVDHTLLNFSPINNEFRDGLVPEAHFRHFGFAKFSGQFLQVKAWRSQGRSVSLSEKGGHEALLPNRRIYPYNFLIKHYPVRSQQHGERKIFRDRRPRWDPDERARGWHVHYDDIGAPHNFLRKPSELHVFDESFAERFLTERLSHVGIPGYDVAYSAR